MKGKSSRVLHSQLCNWWELFESSVYVLYWATMDKAQSKCCWHLPRSLADIPYLSQYSFMDILPVSEICSTQTIERPLPMSQFTPQEQLCIKDNSFGKKESRGGEGQMWNNKEARSRGFRCIGEVKEGQTQYPNYVINNFEIMRP